MTSRAIKLLSILFALSLVAAACGGGDDEGSSDVTTAANEEDQQVETDRSEGEATGEDTRDDPGEAVRGGTLVYGIEADSANPWTAYATSCAISCRMIFRSITDSLFITNDDGEIVPHLVENVVPSDDFTEWTFDVKEGITFHDGTPLDGAAAAYNVNSCIRSPLTSAAFGGWNEAVGSGQTVTLSFENPDVFGPRLLRTEVCGMMFSPEWMQTLSNNPLLTEEEAAAAEGNPSEPVGLGAFKYESYTPGNGNSFIAVRNEDYWRGDGPNSLTGEGLPYLDAVEFVVAVDIQGRSNGLKAGQFDIIHTANADEIAKFEDDGEFVLLQANDFGETSYFLINAAQGENQVLADARGLATLAMDPGNLNSANPMIHLSCRKAFAHAVDRQRIADERGAGIVTPANGPFPPGSLGHLDDTGYPDFDIAAAQAEFENCKEDNGTTPVEFDFNTTNDAFNVETNELVAAMWTEAFGDEVVISITPIEQGQYIGLALAGTFEVQGWRNHGGVDPSEQWFWWNQIAASPIDPDVPELALNFGRFQDAEMDAQYAIIRQNPDEAARQAAAQEVNRLFGQNVWNFWTVWTLWGIVANPRVHDITDLPLTDGGVSAPVISGKHHLAQIWCTDGDCQG